jgi:hypothetical protein
MTEITFMAPDGSRIGGAVQITGEDYWPVSWDDPTDPNAFDDYATDGPSGAEWETVRIGDDVLFIDESGHEWLGRHLIPTDLPRYDDETHGFSPEYCQLASAETAVALELRAATAVLDILSPGSAKHDAATALQSLIKAELRELNRQCARRRHHDMAIFGSSVPVTSIPGDQVEEMAEPLPLGTMQLYRALHDAFADVADAPLDGRLVIEGDALKALYGMVVAISRADPAGEPMSGLTLVDIRPRPAVFTERDDDAARFWNDIDWTHGDQTQANKSGWCVWTDSAGALAVQVSDIPQPGVCFADDDEALAHVTEAAEGDHGYGDDYTALCKRAIAAAGIVVE